VRGISCCHEFAHGYDHQTFKWHHHAAAVACVMDAAGSWRRQLLDRRGGGFLASFLGLWTRSRIFLSGSLAFPLPVATLSFFTLGRFSKNRSIAAGVDSSLGPVARTLSGRGDRQLELVPVWFKLLRNDVAIRRLFTLTISGSFLWAVGRRLLSCLSTAFVDHANRQYSDKKSGHWVRNDRRVSVLAAWFFQMRLLFRFGIGFLVACAMLVLATGIWSLRLRPDHFTLRPGYSQASAWRFCSQNSPNDDPSQT